VLLTDGYIGNENEVFYEVQRELKPGNRLYSFGVGSSVNRFLLNRIAELGRGASQIVRPDEPTEDVAEKFFRQINNPVLTNIQVSWEGTGEAPTIYPSVTPDLFAEQPLVLLGRIHPLPPINAGEDRAASKVRITGIAAGGYRYEKTFNLMFEETRNPAIAQLWGRARIKDLMKQMVGYETKAGVKAVTETALTYQLLSQYTAFVAVSNDVRVNPENESLSMQVPVEMPEGVSYTGIYGSAMTGSVPPQLPIMRSVMPISASAPSSRAYKLQQPGHPSALSLQASSNRSRGKGLFGKAKDAVREMLGQNQSASSVSPPPVSSTPPDECDISFIESAMLADEETLFSPASVTSSPRVQVVRVTGLEQSAAIALTQYLEQLYVPSGLSGEIVFEFAASKGRVGRIVLDEEASTLLDAASIASIKRSLIAWRVPSSATGEVRLTLRIQT
jgi:Ca-activated chloride channel family protein